MLAHGRSRLTVVDRHDADAARQVVAWLDPASAPAPVRTVRSARVLGMLGELQAAGFLVADDAVDCWSPPARAAGEQRGPALRGRTVAVLGHGAASRHVTA